MWDIRIPFCRTNVNLFTLFHNSNFAVLKDVRSNLHSISCYKQNSRGGKKGYRMLKDVKMVYNYRVMIRFYHAQKEQSKGGG